MSRFTDKKSKVLVIDPSGPVRQMMTDVVRTALGFENVEGKASVQDALSYLEAEPDNAFWIIAPLAADQPANALHLLRICSEQPTLKHIRVSLMLDDSESYVIPAAFEMGLLSYHAKPFTKDSLTEELTELLKTLENVKYHEPLAAAHYLRNYLRSTQRYKLQEALERSLLELFPGDPEILLNLVEPQFHLDKKDEARKILQQVKTLDRSLAAKADGISKALFGAVLPATTEGGGVDVLGIKTVVLVDTDESVRKQLENILKELGVADIQGFGDGEAAWAHIDAHSEPDLIMMEWRIPKLSGPLLVQRIRAKNFRAVPIVVVSSLLKADDMPFAREMSIANIVAKPLNRDLLIPAVIWTMQQERLPTEHQVLERKLSMLLAANKVAEAEPLRAQLLGDPQVPIGKKRLVEAKFAFAQAHYTLARDYAVDSLKHSGDSTICLNLLGKCLMFLKNHEAALKCFKKAQELSPHNIERLCSIAEAETELGRHEHAEDALEHAKALDPDSKTVKEAEVKVAIAKGDTAAAQALMGEMESLNDLVAYMNNKAVAFARCGHTQDATDLYRKTVLSIPVARPEIRAIVQYNLALSFARSSELELAVKELEEVLKHKESKVTKKAASLHARLKSALEKNTEFKMIGEESASKPTADQANGADPNALSSPSDHMSLMATIEARRGDICCFLIFNDPTRKDVRIESLFAKPPRFVGRDAIAREESMGVERLHKDAG